MELSGKSYSDDPNTTRAFRIIADHVRCAAFILGDEKGVTPSNVDQGYVLAASSAATFHRCALACGQSLQHIAKVVIAQYCGVYPELRSNESRIITELNLEEERFSRTIRQGLREFEKLQNRLTGKIIDGASAFRLYDTFGFPIEFTLELAHENGLEVDTKGFEEAFKKHQQISGAGAEQRFKAALRTPPKPLPACIPRRTCCTPRCARCWATKWRRRAATSRPSACVSISRSRARWRNTKSGW